MNETTEQHYARMSGEPVAKAKCPSCGLSKPREEVRHDYHCKHSEGLETEDIPCLDCRELAKDGGSIGICDPRVEAH